jgi:hypothetical protein
MSVHLVFEHARVGVPADAPARKAAILSRPDLVAGEHLFDGREKNALFKADVCGKGGGKGLQHAALLVVQGRRQLAQGGVFCGKLGQQGLRRLLIGQQSRQVFFFDDEVWLEVLRESCGQLPAHRPLFLVAAASGS